MKTIRIALVSIALLVGIQVVPHPEVANALQVIWVWTCIDGTYTDISPTVSAITPTKDGCESYGGYSPLRPFPVLVPPRGLHHNDPAVIRLLSRFDEHFDLDQTNHSAVVEFLKKNSETYGGNSERRFNIAEDISRGIPAMNNVLMIWFKSTNFAKVQHTYDAATKTIYSSYPLTLLKDPFYLGTDSYIYFIPKGIIPKAPDGISATNSECFYKSAYWWFYAFAYSNTIFNVTMDGEEGVLLYAGPALAPATSSAPALK